jgi:uncharacterized membrane protein
MEEIKMLKKQIPIIGVLTALTVALSLNFIIPVPATNGFVTLCDAGIYISALFFGPVAGGFVGAISGGAIDLIGGYPQWIAFSMIIHGLQGFTAGYFYKKNNTHKAIIAFAIGTLVMIVGYASATGLLYGWPAGLASIPTNLIQNGFGIAVTSVILKPLKKHIGQPVNNK